MGSNVGGKDERESEGSSRTGSSLKVAEGLRKWAVLSMGILQPESETISSFLSLMMDSGGFAIVEGRELEEVYER